MQGVHALRALSVLCVCIGPEEEDVFRSLRRPLRTLITRSRYPGVRAAATNTLSLACFICSSDDDHTSEMLDFFAEVFSRTSDGELSCVYVGAASRERHCCIAWAKMYMQSHERSLVSIAGHLQRLRSRLSRLMPESISLQTLSDRSALLHFSTNFRHLDYLSSLGKWRNAMHAMSNFLRFFKKRIWRIATSCSNFSTVLGAGQMTGEMQDFGSTTVIITLACGSCLDLCRFLAEWNMGS